MFRENDEVSLEGLKSGRLAALRNAEELVREAEILYENDAWARSYFLSLASVEELGKYIMMTSAVSLVLGGAMNWKRFWKRFRNHQTKFGNILLNEYFFRSGIRPSEYLKKLPEEKKQNADMRMICLYSDFDGSEFYNPSQLIDQEHARVILELAQHRLNEQKEIERSVYAEGYLDRLTLEKVREMWRKAGMEEFFSKLYED